MWIQIRTMDGKRSAQIDGLSKLTKIEDLRLEILKEFGIASNLQRLFFSGKQLEDGHTLFDYGVSLNSLIQVMERVQPMEQGIEAAVKETAPSNGLLDKTTDKDDIPEVNNNAEEEGAYKVHELVDAQDPESGAWFEGIVTMVTRSRPENDHLVYHCIYEGFYEDEIHPCCEKQLRPRSRSKVNWNEISVGDKVMVNYNPDHPKERGDWYDCVVTRKETKRKRNELFGIILFREDQSEAKAECQIVITDEIYKIEKLGEAAPLMRGEMVCKKKGRFDCTECYDDESKPCKECGCAVCSMKTKPNQLVLCDECDVGYHISCLTPPLESVPDDDCPSCKNDTSKIIKPGEKLKLSKRRLSMASSKTTSNRDWGKGMACAGRTKICTIVPENHFGPIPGVEVGTCWRFQVMAGEAGVHRNHVGGISGRANEGAFSILVSGGYEDDIDNGDEVLYTGSGGRDLSGNKRTADQSCDQKLERFNRALAMNCAAPLDEVKGATAVNWRAGKPTRLVRSFKLKKHHPKYAPEEGYRYDGIYKVVKYWPQKGQSGFLVWRYMLRRDDKTPAPWTKEGQKRIKALGIKIQYPDGYLESEAKKREEKERAKEARKLARKSNAQDPQLRGMEIDTQAKKKRKRDTPTIKTSSTRGPSPKKSKASPSFILPEDVLKAIKADSTNERIWEQVLVDLVSYQTFLARVQESFFCICCQELVYKPVTTECHHNICQLCLKRSFKAEVFTCPACRFPLGSDYKALLNDALEGILLKLFPGYTAGR